MNTPDTPRICCRCAQPITGRFERYSPLNSRDDRLICAACVRALLRAVADGLARVPKEARDDWSDEL